MQRTRQIRRLTDADRERARGKIELGKILHRLGDTALGLDSMKSGELIAARILLDKALPNLSSVNVQTSPNLDDLSSINTADLLMLVRALDLIEKNEQNTGNDLQVIDNAQDSRGSDAPDESIEGGGALSQNMAAIINKSADDQHIPVVTDPSHGWADLTSEENEWHIPFEGAEREPCATVEKEPANYSDGNLSCFEKIHTENSDVKDIPTNGTVQTDSKGDEKDGGRKKQGRVQTPELQDNSSEGQSDPVTRRGGSTEPDSGSPQADTPDEKVAGGGISEAVDAEIERMEAEIETFRQEMLNGNESTGSHPDRSGDGRSRTGNRTGLVKGSHIKGRSGLHAGKLR